MKNQSNILLSLLLVCGLIVGCAALTNANKKQVANPNKAATETSTHNKQPETQCFTKIEGGKVDDPYYFLYRLNTTNDKCSPQKATDFLGADKLFNLGKYDSLGLITTDGVNESKGEKSERYQQYYKGIVVGGYEILFNYHNHRISSIAGRFYPNLDIDTTGMLSKEEAAKIVIDNADYYPQFKDKIGPRYFTETTKPLVDGSGKKIVYLFYVNKLSRKPGRYFVDAMKGEILRFSPDIDTYLTDCYKCSGSIATSLSCQDTCTTNLPLTYHLPLPITKR